MSHADAITFQASPNLALVKYWGKTDHVYNLPMNASLGIPLGDLTCRVTIWPSTEDNWIGDVSLLPVDAKDRIFRFFHAVRTRYPKLPKMTGSALANFPVGCGLASSSAFYAALACALLEYVGVSSETERARVARLGSGSATRSIPADAWVAWLPGSDETSCGYSLSHCPLPPDWMDMMWVFNPEHKTISSRIGHQMMDNSPQREGRVHRANMRFMEMCRAIRKQDFLALSRWVWDETQDFMGLMDGHTDHKYLPSQGCDTFHRLLALYEEDPVLRPWMVTVDAGSALHVVGPRLVVEEVVRRCPCPTAVRLSSRIYGAPHRIETSSVAQSRHATVTHTQPNI